jgi:hypothetical protein
MQPKKVVHVLSLVALGLSGCAPLVGSTPVAVVPTSITLPTTALVEATPSALPTAAPAPSPTAVPSAVPPFKYIAMVVFENKEFGTVIHNSKMPYFNQLANSYTLLTQHYAVTHPSLGNYLAMIAGDTFGVTFDCTKCLYDAQTLPDLIEASGRTWRAYQEDMPSACYEGPDYGNYAVKHNPFMYFKSIRLNQPRCAQDDVPIGQLYADIAAGSLPNFVFITPNLCNDAHDCGLDVADQWLQALMLVLQPAFEAKGKPYLIIITWDEGQGNHSCCGLLPEAGGRIATILVSPQAKGGFEDATPYTLYSLPKTIAAAWNLSFLGHAADAENALIVAPWK